MAIELSNHSLKQGDNKEIALQIATILKDIRFGSVEVVIHDGRIVQIDKRERFRITESKSAA
ncbi:YezD family protein [Methylomonas montana]|uniref:YezD family protein n=1 Tax=Methylomonas montana TaxID=3058963 RepID=UPI002659A708|nr:YezD family protein [Methylomonas montana]WKJ91424.1 YezD family protein [Methylomonas montana]